MEITKGEELLTVDEENKCVKPTVKPNPEDIIIWEPIRFSKKVLITILITMPLVIILLLIYILTLKTQKNNISLNVVSLQGQISVLKQEMKKVEEKNQLKQQKLSQLMGKNSQHEDKIKELNNQLNMCNRKIKEEAGQQSYEDIMNYFDSSQWSEVEDSSDKDKQDEYY